MEDRRVQRTRQMLQKALIELILKKGYESITIKEIAEYANVNHATFYLHYKNKANILEVTLREILENLVVELEKDKQCCIDSKLAMVQIFQHVATHADIYRVLLSVQGGVNAVIVQTRNYIASIVERQLISLAPHPLGSIPYSVIAQHTSGALLALISWWLENDMPYSPTVMGEMSCQLSSPPTLIANSICSIS